MVRPIKISENNAPLTCKQHDDNIDALLDRRNHTNKIEDCEEAINQTSLEACVSNLGTVRDIKTSLSDLQISYNNLSQSIAPNGDLETSIQAVDSRLNLNITTISSALLSIATDLELIDEGQTSISSIYNLSQLRLKANASNDPRTLTRFLVGEIKQELQSFISSNQPKILSNEQRLNTLLNSVNGSFTILNNYVNGTVKSKVNKVDSIEATANLNKDSLLYINALLGPIQRTGAGVVDLPNSKTLQKNVIDNRTLGYNNQDSINSINNRIGDTSLLTSPSQTISGDIAQNRNSISSDRVRLNNVINTELPSINSSLSTTNTNLTQLKNSFELESNFLKVIQKPNTDRTIIVSSGPYVRYNGSRGFFNGAERQLPVNRGSYVYLKEVGLLSEIEITEEPSYSGILLATVNVGNTSITGGPYQAHQALRSGFTRPYTIRTTGGTSNTDFTAVGTSTIIRGQQYFKSFTVPPGTIVSIKGGSTIHVRDFINISGRINVEPLTSGGPALKTRVNGSFSGNHRGHGVASGLETYHWSTFLGGTGGTSGIAGSSFIMDVTIPPGGKGGGGLRFVCGGEINVSGVIEANGSSGDNGLIHNDVTGGVSGSGGGAGGAIVLQSAKKLTIESSATLRANGGNGGNSRQQGNYLINGGGGGGGGWITLHSPEVLIRPGCTLECEAGEVGLNGIGTGAVFNPGQGAGTGGSFGGRGGNGSAFLLQDRAATGNVIEIRQEGINY